VHLVGFIIRIYHDARSPERQEPILSLHKDGCDRGNNVLCHLLVTYHESTRSVHVEIHTYILAVPFMSRKVQCVLLPHRRSSVCMANASLKNEVEEIVCKSRIFRCAVRDYFSIFRRCLL